MLPAEEIRCRSVWLTACVPSLLTSCSRRASSSSGQGPLLREGRSWCVQCFQHSSAVRLVGPILATSSHARASKPPMMPSTPAKRISLRLPGCRQLQFCLGAPIRCTVGCHDVMLVEADLQTEVSAPHGCRAPPHHLQGRGACWHSLTPAQQQSSASADQHVLTMREFQLRSQQRASSDQSC